MQLLYQAWQVSRGVKSSTWKLHNCDEIKSQKNTLHLWWAFSEWKCASEEDWFPKKKKCFHAFLPITFFLWRFQNEFEMACQKVKCVKMFQILLKFHQMTWRFNLCFFRKLSILTVVIVIRLRIARRENILDRTISLLDGLVDGKNLIIVRAKLADLSLDVAFVWITRPHQIGV